MKRLTTPEHRFLMTIDPTIIDRIRITYAQCGKIILTKEGEDVEIIKNGAKVRLSQEDTKKFNTGCMVEIQVRILTLGGDALASDIIKIKCEPVLDEEILV